MNAYFWKIFQLWDPFVVVLSACLILLKHVFDFAPQQERYIGYHVQIGRVGLVK